LLIFLDFGKIKIPSQPATGTGCEGIVEEESLKS